MIYNNIGILETNVLDMIKQANGTRLITFNDIFEKTGISQNTLTSIIESLLSKGTIEQKTDDDGEKFGYVLKKTIERPIMLEGNIFLPVSIIRFPEKGTMLVTRGQWYELPIDFDVDRIIWNVAVDTKQKSTLMDIIATSVNKEKATKNVQLPEYVVLQNKEVPYSENIKLLLKVIGDPITDVKMIFRVPVKSEDIADGITQKLYHEGFSVTSKISTPELIAELKKPVAGRDYQNIKINRLFNITDFIFSGNEFPFKIEPDGLTFAKITGIRQGFELSYYKMTTNGVKVLLEKEQYDDASVAVSKITQLFDEICAPLLAANDINCDYIE
jgi:DNA-binding Lrp family transcriptional regulator